MILVAETLHVTAAGEHHLAAPARAQCMRRGARAVALLALTVNFFCTASRSEFS
jgi:hypothetical protein